MLLSGSSAVLASSVIIVVVAWFSKNILYRCVGGFACWLGALAYAGTCLIQLIAPSAAGPTSLPDAHAVARIPRPPSRPSG